MKNTLLKRFFRYVKMDTQSQEGVTDQFPSTEKQKKLARILVQELKEVGCKDTVMDTYGYVMATCKSNVSNKARGAIPVIGFLAHMDTSPDVSGKNVKPMVHKNYQGGDIPLLGDSTQIITVKDNPELKKYLGKDIITSDGTTLLGADDKAGIAEIITMLQYLQEHPEVKHGDLKIGFTPDEEIGRGTEHFDLKKFKADYAYTVDGGKAGEVENETFNASLAEISVRGKNIHPGYAQGKLVNSIKIISDIIHKMQNLSAPETTEKRKGYLHPYQLQGGVEKSTVKILLRDFEPKGIKKKTDQLKKICASLQKKYPRAKINCTIKEQYQNMHVILDKEPRVTEYALQAVEQSGLKPKLQYVRGGTDGARLSYKGLLTPNLFTGGMNFHSKTEWIPLPAMEKAVETLVNLVKIWAERK